MKGAVGSESPRLSISLGLDEDDWLVLAARVDYGLTLNEIAAELYAGVTRQRASQIWQRAIRRAAALAKEVDPLLSALERHHRRLEGADLDAASRVTLHASIAELLRDNGWPNFHSDQSEYLVALLRSLAFARKNNLLQRWPNITLSCCRMHPLVARHPTVQQELFAQQDARRRNTYADLALSVLEEAGEPLHWQELSNRAEALNRRSQFSPSGFFNALSSDKELFVRVDRGTYALAAWGHEEAEAFPDIIARAMGHAGHPMTFGAIYAKVCEVREISKKSLGMFLDLHPRFYRSKAQTYGLRAWLAPRDKQTLRTPIGLVEDPGSFNRVARSSGRYDIDRIVAADREAYPRF